MRCFANWVIIIIPMASGYTSGRSLACGRDWLVMQRDPKDGFQGIVIFI